MPPHLTNSAKPLKAHTVVVTHVLELRVFAKESYEKYQGVVKMAQLADSGVEFRMCSNAVRATGFKPRRNARRP